MTDVERHRPRREGGVPHRHDRPARPGADRHAQGRAAGQDRARLRRADEPARLSASRIRRPGPSRSTRSPRRSSWPSGRSSTPAAASSAPRPATSCARFAKKTGIPVTMTVHGPGRLPQPTIRCALRHARHARHVYANYAVERGRPAARPRRAVRRPRDRQGRASSPSTARSSTSTSTPSEINKNKAAHIPDRAAT